MDFMDLRTTHDVNLAGSLSMHTFAWLPFVYLSVRRIFVFKKESWEFSSGFQPDTVRILLSTKV